MELDLDQARRRAKELLRAARARDPEALARLRDDRAPRLADAQRAVAGEPRLPLVARARSPRGGLDAATASSGAPGSCMPRSTGARTSPSACSPTIPRSRRAGLDVALVLGDARRGGHSALDQ